MYLRLTSRCNMSCEHCAFSCGARGKDMTRDIFEAALRLNGEYEDPLTLGGGEPTLHPQFWEFFGAALAASEFPLAIVTNGKNKNIAIALAKMAKSGCIYAALSQDYWHERIDYEVVQAFTKPHREHSWGSTDNDCREIRNVSNEVISIGRAKKNQLGTRDHCVCDCLVVEPTGRLWECGCRKQNFGTVFAPAIPDSYWKKDTRCSRAA